MTSRVHRKSHHRALDNHTDFSLLSSRKVLQKKKRKEKKRKEKKKQTCCAIQQMKIYPVDSEQPRPEVN